MLAEATSTTFDLVLIVHVLVGVVAVVVLGAAYVAAAGLGRVAAGEPWPDAAGRFFTPGPDLAGRTVYLVPLSGLALVGLSRGEFHLDDPFVSAGLALAAGVIAIGEVLVFPASTRLGRRVHGSGTAPSDGAWRADLSRLRWGVDAMVLGLVVAAILMVAKP